MNVNINFYKLKLISSHFGYYFKKMEETIEIQFLRNLSLLSPL